MLVHHFLERTAARVPEALAVQTDEARLTFAELDARANALAHGLTSGGVSRGDRVVVCLDNRVETVVAIFAVLKAGAAFVMVNATAKEEKLTHILRHAEAAGVILPARSAERMAASLAGIESLRVAVVVDGTAAVDGKTVVGFSDLVAAGGPSAPSATIDLDLAALLYTSGSTGHPKGVMLTHANIRSAIESVVEYLELTGNDRLMNVLPLSFGYGLTQLFSAVAVGAPLFLEKGIVFPPVTLSKMARERVTGFAMVPTIAAVLLGLDLGKYDLSALRYITNAGAGLPVPHAQRIRALLPHVQLVLMYGQTECLRISYLPPAEVDHRPDSVGRGMPNQELLVLDSDGEPVADNEVGELVVRGSHVMRGYWRMPDATAGKLRPGRLPGEVVLHTGDLFRRDAEGYLYFVARSDDIIKSKGEKVSPREVENALCRLEGVTEVAVVGVEHPVFGEAVKAIVVLRPGVTLTARDIQRHCAGCLEDYMVPSMVEFRDSLPKSDNGKILKGGLRDQLAAV